MLYDAFQTSNYQYNLKMDSLLDLKRGSVGDQVKYLQRILNRHIQDSQLPETPLFEEQLSIEVQSADDYCVTKTPLVMEPLAIDGDFGPLTEKALIAFQKSQGISPSGKVDTRTFEYLVPQWTEPRGKLLGPHSTTDEDQFNVVVLKAQLRYLHFLNSYETVNYYYTDTNKSAVQEFQLLYYKSLNIKIMDGLLDDATDTLLKRKTITHAKYNNMRGDVITQTGPMHCWAASLAMLKRSTGEAGWDGDAGVQRAIKHMQTFQKHRLRDDDQGYRIFTGYDSGLQKWADKTEHVNEKNNIEIAGPILADHFRFQFLSIKNCSIQRFHQELQNGPLMLFTLPNADKLNKGIGQNLHAIVMSSMVSINWEQNHTYFEILNPWPEDSKTFKQGNAATNIYTYYEFMETWEVPTFGVITIK